MGRGYAWKTAKLNERMKKLGKDHSIQIGGKAMDEGTLGAGRGASEKDVEAAVNGLPKDDLLKFVQAFCGIDALWLKLMPRGGRESWMDDYRMAATGSCRCRTP